MLVRVSECSSYRESTVIGGLVVPNTNPTPTRILLLTALDWKSTRRFTDKLADSLQLDY